MIYKISTAVDNFVEKLWISLWITPLNCG